MFGKTMFAAVAATLVTATPAQAQSFDLVGWLNAAKGGETLTLPAGNYGSVVFPKKVYSAPVKVMATGSTFTKLTLQRLGNVVVEGGRVVGTGGQSIGIDIRWAKGVRVQSMTVTKAYRAITMSESQDIALISNKLDGIISDGVNIAMSQRVRIEGNTCSNFTPTEAVYDAAGKLIKDGDHADCVQAWSRPGYPPTSDVLVINNTATGKMQGIFFGNQVRNGVDDGGFDRIKIKNNRVTLTYTNGVRIEGGRGSVVTGNNVYTVTGAMLLNKLYPVKTTVLLMGGSDNIGCGNYVAAMASPFERVCSAAELAR